MHKGREKQRGEKILIGKGQHWHRPGLEEAQCEGKRRAESKARGGVG